MMFDFQDINLQKSAYSPATRKAEEDYSPTWESSVASK